jgi:hypothetical protein
MRKALGERMMGALWNLPMLFAPSATRSTNASTAGQDALFELADAILAADGSAPSPAHLSLQALQASHRRGWGSLYTPRWIADGSTTKPYGSF